MNMSRKRILVKLEKVMKKLSALLLVLVGGCLVSGCTSSSKITDSGTFFISFGNTLEIGQRSASMGGTTATSEFTISSPLVPDGGSNEAPVVESFGVPEETPVAVAPASGVTHSALNHSAPKIPKENP
jgi:hypothetical protein